MPRIYPHRFDAEYLDDLTEQLRPDQLKASALLAPKTFDGIIYPYCISIDFCGLAATTLLYPHQNHDALNGTTIDKRKAILAAFEQLFDAEVLKDLNDSGFYLRVRFCFAYLFSDFPLCLMKAELSGSWKYMGDVPVHDYFINRPLNGAEFRNADIHVAQEASLRAIIRIINTNNQITIIDGQLKSVNSIQVRFSTIPSPICLLLINDTAYYDLYLYNKSESHDHLALRSPVVIIRDEELRSPRSFDYFRKHFNYLWRHDLTLFCCDATKITPENTGGLSAVLPPDRVSGPQGTNWGHKEQRIWEKKIQETGVTQKTAGDNDRIISWKANLNQKLGVCTRIIGDEKFSSGNSQVFLTIGARRQFFYFHLECKDQDIEFEYLSGHAELVYCVLAHYAYARLNKAINPILLDYARDIRGKSGRLKSRLISALNASDLGKTVVPDTNKGGGDLCFDAIFNSRPFEMIIPADNISFDERSYAVVKTAKYEVASGEFVSCLDYTYRPA